MKITCTQLGDLNLIPLKDPSKMTIPNFRNSEY